MIILWLHSRFLQEWGHQRLSGEYSNWTPTPTGRCLNNAVLICFPLECVSAGLYVSAKRENSTVFMNFVWAGLEALLLLLSIKRLDTDQTCNYFMGFVFPCIMILILSCQTWWAAFMWLPEILGKTQSCLPQGDCWWSLTKKSSCWANQQNSVRWQRLPKIESDWGCFKLTVGLDVSLCCSWGSKVIQGSLLRTTAAPEGMWWAALFVKDFLGFAFKADVLKDLFWGIVFIIK